MVAGWLGTISLKKQRNLPALIEALGSEPLPWLANRRIVFNGPART